MMRGTQISPNCEKSLASSQSLWNHKKRCKGHTLTYPNRFSPSKENDKPRSNLFEQLRQSDPTPLSVHSIDDERKSSVPRPPHDESSHSSSEDGSSSRIESLTIDEEDNTYPDEEEEEEEEELKIIDGLINNDSVSSAEDDEDVIKDAGVWHTINCWAENHGNSVLYSFNFFFLFRQALNHDDMFEKVMDSVHAIRDDESDDTIGFKTVLDHALEKRKFLIERRIEEEENKSPAAVSAEDINVSKFIKDESEDDDVFSILKCYILLSRSLDRDKVFRSVMEMVHDCMDYNLDRMNFHEAVRYAIDQKREIILDTAAAARTKENSGRGFFLTPYKGRGMNNESSDDDDDDAETCRKMWEIIAEKRQDNLSAFKLFCQLHHSIDLDSTFQHVLNEISVLRYDNVDLTFAEALDKVIEKEKPLIHQAFENAMEEEEECETDYEDKGTNVWCSILRKVRRKISMFPKRLRFLCFIIKVLTMTRYSKL